MTKKALTALLAAAMALTAFSACTRSSPTPAPTAAPTAAATAAPASATPAPTAAPAEQTPSDAPVKIVLLTTESDTIFPRADTPNFKNIQQIALERFNIDYQLETIATEYETVLNTRFAAGVNLPDIVNHRYTQDKLVDLYENGLILRLNDLIKEYAPFYSKVLEERPLFIVANGDREGNVLRIPSHHVENPQHRMRTMHIRNDWLNAVGYNYTDMLTTDNFYDALVAAGEFDASGAGKQPLVWGNVFQIGQSMGSAFNAINISDSKSAESWYFDNNGNVYNSLSTKEAQDYITYMHQLYSEGMLFSGFSNWTSEQYNEHLLNNLIAARYGPWWESVLYNPRVRDQGFEGVELVPLGRPLSNDGNPKMYLLDLGGYGGMMITKDCKNPEAAMKLLDWGWDPLDGSILNYYGVDDYDKGTEYWQRPDSAYEYAVANYTHIATQKWIDEIAEEPLLWAKMGYNQPFLPVQYLVGTAVDVAVDLADFGEPAGIAANIPFNIDGLYEAEYTYGIPAINFVAPSKDQANKWLEFSDLWLYMNETIDRFVSGEEPLTNWDSFITTAKQMGLDEATAIKDDQYKAYLAITGK